MGETVTSCQKRDLFSSEESRTVSKEGPKSGKSLEITIETGSSESYKSVGLVRLAVAAANMGKVAILEESRRRRGGLGSSKRGGIGKG